MAADSASLSITGDITIECLVNPESQPGTDTVRALVSKNESTGNELAYTFRYADEGGTKKLTFTISDDGTNTDGHVATQTLSNGTWYRVGVAFDASLHSAEFFVNGVSIGTDATGTKTSINDSTAVFEIGAENGGAQLFDGKITDIRVFNDLRTDAELDDFKYKAVLSDTGGLQGNWKFVGGSLLDETSNNNDLTNNNAVTFAEDTACPVFFTNVSSPEAWKADTLFLSHYETTVGVAKETVAASKDVLVVVQGGVTGLSGLSANNPLYVTDTRGTLGANPGTNLKQVGTALSTTEMLVNI